jgi:hypothetical protein
VLYLMSKAATDATLRVVATVWQICLISNTGIQTTLWLRINTSQGWMTSLFLWRDCTAYLHITAYRLHQTVNKIRCISS